MTLNDSIQARDNVIPEKLIDQNQLISPPEMPFTFPPIAGFWRRFFAWVVDSLILGIAGQILGLFFSSYLNNLGPYGRPIGLLFILPYFGILNSKIGGGQTVGKRWMKIAVRNKDNEPIGLWRSIARIAILTLPAGLNQWQNPIFENIVVSWIASVIIFGLGGAILYTMVFNKKTRQGIHDLLLGTYVVHLVDKPIKSFPITSRIHWIVSTILVGVTIIGVSILSIFPGATRTTSSLTSMKSLYAMLKKDPRFFEINVQDFTSHSSTGKTSRTLIVTGWHKGKIGPDNREEVAISVAKIAIENMENISQFDGIQVSISTGYDIGIASASKNSTLFYSVENWLEKISSFETSNGYIPNLLEFCF